MILPLLGVLTLQLALRRRAYFGVPLLFHLMLVAPWHILWGFPYALAAAGCELFLVAFPFASTQTGRDGSASVQLIGVALVGLTFDVCASRYLAERRRLVA